MPTLIQPISSDKEIREFIDLQWDIYKHDPHWVPPLVVERKDHLNPKKNPFFAHAQVQLFVARDEKGKVLGRISAQINDEYDKRHGKGTGFFGLFEAPEDPALAEALMATAEKWCKEKGCTKIIGPMSFSINDECGLLVEGFDTSPYIFMPHNPRYYQKLIEDNGYQKAKDLIAWHFNFSQAAPEGAVQFFEYVKTAPGVTIRNLDPKQMERDVDLLLEVFNEAWSQNWGYVPLTKAESQKLAADFTLIAEPGLIQFIEVDGKLAAVSMGLPNLHEVIKDLNGCRNPLNFVRLLYRVKAKKFTQMRLVILGVKKEYRGGIFAGGALSVALYVLAHQACVSLGYKTCELGWTLEDNDKINKGIELMGASRSKLYRIYEKTL
jgi:GNAT superfamily N-acetyltransferase